MRVLMLGWEFPPFISGGLGTACYGLTKALSESGNDVIFVLPRPVSAPFSTHVKLVAPAPGSPLETPATEYRVDEFENVTFHAIPSQLYNPYDRPADYVQTQQAVTKLNTQHITATTRWNTTPGKQGEPEVLTEVYHHDMFNEVERYASLVSQVAQGQDFDVIHAHDWMTFPAAIKVAQATGKPLVVHIHSTEFDRAGDNVDSRIYDIERQGMHAADKIIAVSHLTKNTIIARYGIDGGRVEVVYNAVYTATTSTFDPEKYDIKKDEKLVLFLGRITMQKGPEYFIAAAKKVLEVMDNVKFVMAGAGDMVRRTVEMASAMGIGHKVLFTGFLRGRDVDRVFKMADLYVMPSISEPFGIAPLEAMSHDVPVIISKQSGVSEVLEHVLKVDFWDVNEMANKIVAVLRHPPLSSTLRAHGAFEVRRLSWADSAAATVKVYEQALGMPGAMLASDRQAPTTRASVTRDIELPLHLQDGALTAKPDVVEEFEREDVLIERGIVDDAVTLSDQPPAAIPPLDSDMPQAGQFLPPETSRKS